MQGRAAATVGRGRAIADPTAHRPPSGRQDHPHHLVAVVDPRGIADPADDPERFGAWVENACLAFAWNAGQRVSYWREEPLEVDGIFEGSWGSWAVEVKTGRFQASQLKGLFEFSTRHPSFRPLVICEADALPIARRAGATAIAWRQFLLEGPPR